MEKQITRALNLLILTILLFAGILFVTFLLIPSGGMIDIDQVPTTTGAKVIERPPSLYSLIKEEKLFSIPINDFLPDSAVQELKSGEVHLSEAIGPYALALCLPMRYVVENNLLYLPNYAHNSIDVYSLKGKRVRRIRFKQKVNPNKIFWLKRRKTLCLISDTNDYIYFCPASDLSKFDGITAKLDSVKGISSVIKDQSNVNSDLLLSGEAIDQFQWFTSLKLVSSKFDLGIRADYGNRFNFYKESEQEYYVQLDGHRLTITKGNKPFIALTLPDSLPFGKEQLLEINVLDINPSFARIHINPNHNPRDFSNTSYVFDVDVQSKGFRCYALRKNYSADYGDLDMCVSDIIQGALEFDNLDGYFYNYDVSTGTLYYIMPYLDRLDVGCYKLGKLEGK